MTHASSPVCPSILANCPALSKLAFARWTSLSAISMLNKVRIPSRREFMIAALAANSVVGTTDGTGVGTRLISVLGTGTGVFDLDGI